MTIKFITALSWLWGAWCLYGVVACGFGIIEPKDTAKSGMNMLAGLPAWAWLIARYLL